MMNVMLIQQFVVLDDTTRVIQCLKDRTERTVDGSMAIARSYGLAQGAGFVSAEESV
jgi:hypothetical protein